MPFSTNQNQGMAQGVNSLVKAFVGDPAADAAYNSQQVKNETEYQRQKYLQEQTISEAVRRKTMEAQAAAAYASANAANGLASERNRQNKAHIDLGAEFTKDHTNYNQPGGMSTPGSAPAGTPGKGFNMADPATAAKVVSLSLTGGMDPKTLAPIAMMPGQDDDTLGRIMVGTGNTLGKDEYVGTGDRNTNRNYELGAGERLVGSDGTVRQGVDQSYVDHQKNGGAGKRVNGLSTDASNIMIKNAIRAHKGVLPPGPDPKYTISSAEYLSPQPELYADMLKLVGEGWQKNGGNAAATQELLMQYLNGADFSKFGSSVDNPDLFTGGTIQTIKRGDVNAILNQLTQGQGIDPSIFTGGAPAPVSAPVELKRPAMGGGKPVNVGSPQEAMKLPSGTQFTTPDGVTRVRQ